LRVGEKGGSGKVGVLLDHTVKNNFNEHGMLDDTARNVLCLAIDSALSVRFAALITVFCTSKLSVMCVTTVEVILETFFSTSVRGAIFLIITLGVALLSTQPRTFPTVHTRSSDFDIFLEIQYASCVFGLALKS
jgi:hypothetical protein